MGGEAAEVFSEELGKESVEYVKASSYVGRGENKLGNHNGALEILFEAAEHMKAWTNPTEDQSIAMTSVYNNIATSYNGLDDNDQYVSYIRKALKEMISAKGELNQNVAALYNNLGHSYYFTDQYDSAEFYSLKALEIADELYNGKPNDRPQFSHCDLAKIYIEMDNLKAAMKHAEYCYSMASALYGEYHASTARGLGVMGDVYLASEDYENSSEYFTRATLMYEEFYGETSAMLAWHYWDEADRFYRMENLRKAIEYKRKSLNMYYKTMPEAQLYIGESKHMLANLLIEVDSSKKALPLLRES